MRPGAARSCPRCSPSPARWRWTGALCARTWSGSHGAPRDALAPGIVPAEAARAIHAGAGRVCGGRARRGRSSLRRGGRAHGGGGRADSRAPGRGRRLAAHRALAQRPGGARSAPARPRAVRGLALAALAGLLGAAGGARRGGARHVAARPTPTGSAPSRSAPAYCFCGLRRDVRARRGGAPLRPRPGGRARRWAWARSPGTSLPIDREHCPAAARLRAADGATAWTRWATATSRSTSPTPRRGSLLHASRLATDVIDFASREFGFVRAGRRHRLRLVDDAAEAEPRRVRAGARQERARASATLVRAAWSR